ncbi:MAG: hypothetical protein Q8S21_06250 [Candidatus Paracaedibacteraceae bacterium]|nr:hypothetical protein [Candidatus Paracaedibacteraceae bacterium]
MKKFDHIFLLLIILSISTIQGMEVDGQKAAAVKGKQKNVLLLKKEDVKENPGSRQVSPLKNSIKHDGSIQSHNSIDRTNSYDDMISNVSKEWKENILKVADSFDITCDECIEIALKTFEQLKKNDPYGNYPRSLEDLATFEKPDSSKLIETLNKMNQGNPKEKQIDIEEFIKKNIPSKPTFSVPAR